VRLYDHRVPAFFLCHHVHNMDVDGAIFVRCLLTSIHGECSRPDQLSVALAANTTVARRRANRPIVLVLVVVVLDLSVRKPNRRIDDDEDEHENEKTRDFRIFLTVLVVVVVLGPSVRKANRGRRRDTIEDNGLVV
jgi:hypothetical protein